MKTMDYISITLVIIGALNWGLIGFFNFDLISTIFGGGLMFVSRVVFALIGLAGLYSLSLYGRMDYDEEQVRQVQHIKR